MKEKKIKIIECPRDAMQGLHEFIPTEVKANYINSLLNVGFDTIDFGSFVSPKAIPQMRDTVEVLKKLDLSSSSSKLLSIVVNKRGAEDASQFEEIDYLGFPFSVSETFQNRNANSTIEDSLNRVKDLQEVSLKSNKKLVVYLSMAFGNPYGDPWNVDIVQKWVDLLASYDIKILSLSDTIGVANSESVSYLFKNLIPPYPDVEFGAHFHTQPHTWRQKVDAAYMNGCLRFDTAINGYGGCPMAKDDLTGNMATENVLHYFKEKNVDLGLNNDKFNFSQKLATKVFP